MVRAGPAWAGLGWEVEKRLSGEEATEGGQDHPLRVSGDKQVFRAQCGLRTLEHLESQASMTTNINTSTRGEPQNWESFLFPRAFLPRLMNVIYQQHSLVFYNMCHVVKHIVRKGDKRKHTQNYLQ